MCVCVWRYVGRYAGEYVNQEEMTHVACIVALYRSNDDKILNPLYQVILLAISNLWNYLYRTNYIYTRRWLVSIVVITAKPRHAITCNYDGTFNIAARSYKLKQRVRRPLNQYQSVEYALICLSQWYRCREKATGAIFDRGSENHFATLLPRSLSMILVDL